MTIRFDSELERELQIHPQVSLTKFMAGEAIESDWHTLVQRLNTGQVMAHRHFTEEIRKTCRDALDACVVVNDRHEKHNSWGMTGDEFRIIGFALTLTDDMQKKCTRRELKEVIDHVFKIAAI